MLLTNYAEHLTSGIKRLVNKGLNRSGRDFLAMDENELEVIRTAVDLLDEALKLVVEYSKTVEEMDSKINQMEKDMKILLERTK